MNIILIKRQKNMKIKRIILSFIAFGIIISGLSLTSSCTNSGASDANTNAEEPGKEEITRQVNITKQQFDALKVEFGTIEQKNLENNLKSTGFLKVPPQNKANITSVLGGTVQSILVQEGDKVTKGQTVVTLANPEFIKMQEEYLDAQSQLVYAETDYNRQKELSAMNVTARKTFQQSTSNLNSLKAKVNSLKQQLAILNINTTQLTSENIYPVISIISPISGNISEIDINIGANVEASTTLMDVVDNSRLHLDLFVFEQDLPEIKIGQNVDFTLTNLPGRNFTAKIFAIGSAFENQTKTIPIHAEITGNKSELIEGMNVTGLININNVSAPSVLSTAIVSYSGNDYIFIRVDEKENPDGELFYFEKIQVKKGVTSGGYTEVIPLGQIPENSKVVTNGAFYLMAMLTNTGEEE
jgi:membrane fusion protein, heavy metal efflux system